MSYLWIDVPGADRERRGGIHEIADPAKESFFVRRTGRAAGKTFIASVDLPLEVIAPRQQRLIARREGSQEMSERAPEALPN